LHAGGSNTGSATRQLGSGTIAYSISETAFTIQFGGYQPAPIRYLDFAWLPRKQRALVLKEEGTVYRRA